MCYVAALAYLCSLAAGAVDAHPSASKPILEQTQKQSAGAAELKAGVSKDRKIEAQKDAKSELSKNPEMSASESEKADKGTPSCRSASWSSSEVWINGKLVDSSEFKSPVSTDCNAMPASGDRYYDGQPRRSGRGSVDRLRFDIEEF